MGTAPERLTAAAAGRLSSLLAPAVTVPVVGLLAAIGYAAQWYAPSPARSLWAVLWDLVVGTGLAAVGCAVTAVDRRSVPGALLLLAAALLLGAASLLAGHRGLAEATWVLVVLVVAPLALLRVVPARPVPRIMRGFDVLIVVLGGTAAVGRAVTAPVVLGVAATAAGMVVLAAGWVLFESTSGDDRRRVLWVVLGTVVTGLASGLLLAAIGETSPGYTVLTVVAATISLALPAGAALALLNPRLFDVRDLIGQLAVLLVMFALTLAVYQGGEALAQSITGHPVGRALRLLLVLLVAAGFHPTMRWIRGSIDEMLFGGRADPVDTLNKLGSRLAAGASPAEWLETLRTALAVPGVVLRGGDGVIAQAGELDGPTVTTALRTGAEQVGELVVALPPEQLRAPPTTAAVLNLVALPLAQALHADALAEQLRASRGRVVAALEEERRRMRRDLHDGLGPTLTGIAYGADAATNLLQADPGEARVVLRQVRADAGEAIAEVRRIVYGLRPKALDELGLAGAVRQRLSHLHAVDGTVLAVELTAPDPLPELAAAVEVAAYRVAVEAVTNIARHAGVAEAEVAFAVLDGALFRVRVSDAGHSTRDWTEGIGLRSMRERVEQIGGTLTVTTGPAGSIVTADIPLDVPAD